MEEQRWSGQVVRKCGEAGRVHLGKRGHSGARSWKERKNKGTSLRFWHCLSQKLLLVESQIHQWNFFKITEKLGNFRTKVQGVLSEFLWPCWEWGWGPVPGGTPPNWTAKVQFSPTETESTGVQAWVWVANWIQAWRTGGHWAGNSLRMGLGMPLLVRRKVKLWRIN